MNLLNCSVSYSASKILQSKFVKCNTYFSFTQINIKCNIFIKKVCNIKLRK